MLGLFPITLKLKNAQELEVKMLSILKLKVGFCNTTPPVLL